MEIAIVLLPVENFDRRDVANYIENQEFTVEQLVEKFGDKIQIMSLTDFMDECNDEEINLNFFWLSYVKLIKKKKK